MGEKARLFVAVIPPPAVLDAVAALSRPEDPGVRYTTRDQWHITLRFLGWAVADDAVAALQAVHAPRADVRLGPELSRLGRSVVVVPATGLEAVATAVVEVTADIGRPPESRPFAGHLTVARLKGRPPAGLTGQAFDASFTAEDVHLVRSHLSRAGARYEVVATRALDAGA